MKKKSIDKLMTRINNLTNTSSFRREGNKIKLGHRVFFEFNERCVKYKYLRFYPLRLEPISEESFRVTIMIEDDKFSLLNSNIINPPKYVKSIVRLISKLSGREISHIIIGEHTNSFTGNTLKITKETYDILNGILTEEGLDKNIRVENRIVPILQHSFKINVETSNLSRDYSLLLKEIIETGNFSQEDVLEFADKLDTGFRNKIVIEKQIKKQTQWLIDTLQIIIDEPEINVNKAKELGSKHFYYPKNSIKGPEQLMEKILTEYGKNTFFGSPILINTDKYVISNTAVSRSQFDILLVNQLNDLEVVELKRPDKPLLSFDSNRNKFYVSKDLSIAISQAERYLSALIRDNDDEYLICGKKIREYLNDQIGGTTQIEIIRPSAIIIMGSYQMITEPYEDLNGTIKSKVKKEHYLENSFKAYKEIKNAFKNIQIMTYSELIENARLRLA